MATEEQRAARQLGVLRFVPDLYVVGLLAILGAIVIVGLYPRVDDDMWWHLKTGQYIVQHGAVPTRDFMSFTMAGRPWTDHEWLAEAAMYGSYLLAGLWGPIGLFALVVLGAFILVYAQLIGRGAHPVLAMFGLAASFLMSSASWGPRVQMVTLLFLAAFGYLLLQYERHRNRRLLLAFPLLMLLWANLHGGFVLGIVLMALVLAGQWINRVARHADAWSREDLRFLSFALIATVVVTVINPNGVRQLLYPLTFVLPNAYTNQIQESASPNFHMPVMMIFEGVLLLLLFSLYATRRRLNWAHIAVIIPFTHLALSQSRNVAVWAVVVAPYAVAYVQEAAGFVRSEFPGVSYRRRPVEGRLGQVLNLVLLVMVVIVYTAEGARFVNPAALRTAEREYPRGGIAYLRTHRLPARVFVSYTWGGYLLWNLSPRYRDYMDSRADTLFNDRILRGYLDAYAAAPDWRSVLDRYRVGTVLIERSAPLAQVLSTAKGWRLRYRDGGTTLYSRSR